MNFFKFLNEMNQKEAQKLFNMDSSYTEDELKKKFRELSKIHHPDIGGSEDMMKKINAAYATLKKNVGSGSNDDFNVRYARDTKEYTELGKAIAKDLAAKFKKDTFEAYFKKLTNMNFTTKITLFPDEKYNSKHSHPWAANIKAEFRSDDDNYIVNMSASADLTDIKYSKGLGSNKVEYKLIITTEVVAFNKTHKLGKSNWSFTDSHKVLDNPKHLFPNNKMVKIFVGDTSTRKFSKRDMISVLKNKMNAKADSSKDTFFIYVTDNIYFSMYRMTFMRLGTWNIGGSIFEGYKRVESIDGITTFMESEEMAEKFVELYKELKRCGENTKKMKQVLEQFIKENKLKG